MRRRRVLQCSAIPAGLGDRAPRRRDGALRVLALGVCLAVASLLSASPAVAAPASPVVIPPAGSSYDDLAVAWWQYVDKQPAATNPLTDTTGANCATGQSGAVFFLVGTAGSGSVSRTCTVRAGKRLFFPLLNAFDVHVPGDGLDTPAKVLADFQSFNFRADTLFATIDGTAVAHLDPATTPYRACAEPVPGCTPPSFSLTFPADNLFGLAAGTYQPAVQDGYYLLLPPLPPGQHRIEFGGMGNFAGRVAVDVVYQLTVAP